MLSPLERDHILSTCVCFSKHAFTLPWLALEFFPAQSHGTSLGCPSQELAWDPRHYHVLTPHFPATSFQRILINLSLVYRFASHWVPSAPRYEEPEFHWTLRQAVQFQSEDCGFKSHSKKGSLLQRAEVVHSVSRILIYKRNLVITVWGMNGQRVSE